jgi:hypothetical protein
MKISLNSLKMNEALAMLKEAMTKEETTYFKIQCENCTLSIVTEYSNADTIEVALRNADDSAWMQLEMDEYTEERPIIRTLPLLALPVFSRQFRTLEIESMAEVWDAWDTISCYRI